MRAQRRGFTLIELLVVMSIIGILASLGLAGIPVIREQVRRIKSQDNLRNMRIILMNYVTMYGSLPSVQPKHTRFERGGGVRDLYPLYQTGLLNKDNLKLLQPPGVSLIPFSANPTIEEFDKNHIGYAYNSTANLDDPDNPPVMSEQGVSTGVLDLEGKDPGRKPVFKNGVNVLFADGTIEFIPAVNGKLSTAKIKPEMWAKLLD